MCQLSQTIIYERYKTKAKAIAGRNKAEKIRAKKKFAKLIKRNKDEKSKNNRCA